MADRTATLKAVREKYPQYADMTDDALGRALATKYPAYADLAPAPSAVASRPMPPAPPMIAPGTILSGALKETFGMGERPGAVPLTGTPETKTPLGVLLKPEGVAEHLAQAAVTTPLIAAAGGGAAALGSPAVLGRIAALAGIGGASSVAHKGSLSSLDALLHGVAAGSAEALLGLIPHLGTAKRLGNIRTLAELAEKMRVTKAGLKYATESIQLAFDAVKARLKTAKINIPSLSGKPMVAQDAIDRLKGREGHNYQQTLKEIASELDRLDIQKWITTAAGGFVRGPRPRAGTEFLSRAAPERFVYAGTPAERAAEHIVGALKHPGTRAVMDVAATEEIAPGVPAGAVVPVVAGSELGRIAGAAMRRMMP